MKKKLTAAVMVLMMLAACGKEEVTEADSSSGRVREEKTADNTEETATSTPEAEEEGVTELTGTIVYHTYSSEDTVPAEDGEDPFPIAYSMFPTIELDEESRLTYARLDAGLELFNEDKEEEALRFIANMVQEMQDDPDFVQFMYSSMLEEQTVTMCRADEKIFSFCIDSYGSYNGAHPMTWYNGYNFDAITGEQLPLSDVVSDIKGLPQIILDNLETVSDDYEFTDEDNAEMLEKIESFVADGGLEWTLTDTAMEIYFDAYDLQYYAFGPIFATLEYKDYPDLIIDEYKPTGSMKESLGERFKEENRPEEIYPTADLLDIAQEMYESSADGYIYAPDWSEPYVSDDVTEGLSDMPFELKEKKKEDLTYVDSWAADNGYEITGAIWNNGVYSDNGYNFEINNDADNGVLYLTYSEDGTPGDIHTYHFESFMYTPDPGNEFTTPYIRYAKVEDDTLYVNIAHRTYSADQPDTAYMLAIDTGTGLLKWKSANLVANSDNFVIYKDTVICGYGFTKEDDYVYILSKYTGNILKKIKVKSSPDDFILDGDTLYVLCYDTAYTYELK